MSDKERPAHLALPDLGPEPSQVTSPPAAALKEELTKGMAAVAAAQAVMKLKEEARQAADQARAAQEAQQKTKAATGRPSLRSVATADANTKKQTAEKLLKPVIAALTRIVACNALFPDEPQAITTRNIIRRAIIPNLTEESLHPDAILGVTQWISTTVGKHPELSGISDLLQNIVKLRNAPLQEGETPDRRMEALDTTCTLFKSKLTSMIRQSQPLADALGIKKADDTALEQLFIPEHPKTKAGPKQ